MKHVTPDWANFWSRGHNLNKLGRGLLNGATYNKLKALGIGVSRIFIYDFPI